MTLTRNVLASLQEAEEGITALTNISIPNQINNIEYLINMGLGDEDDDPPQKVLKLTR